MKFLTIAICLCQFMLTSCASKSPELKKVAEDKSKHDLGFQCSREAVVGTRFKRNVCSTKAQRDRAKRDADRFLKDETYKNIRMKPPTDAGL